jgi:putative endonuclease
MSRFVTYMLQCADNSYYVGPTDNIDQRFYQHQVGKVDGYTKTRLPVRLVWMQVFTTRDAAFRAERRIKGWSRSKKMAFVQGDWEAISKLANTKKSMKK